MKKFYLSFLTILLLTSHVGISQSITVNAIAPTCYTCCDGSWTITLDNCPGGATLGIVGPNANLNFFTNFGVLTFTKACCGQYTISMLGSAQCNNTQLTTNYMVPCNITGLELQNIDQSSQLLFPNPLTDKCYMKIDGTKTIEVTDLLGKIIQKITTDNFEIDFSDMKSGIYYISIYSDKGILVTRQKVIRN